MSAAATAWARLAARAGEQRYARVSALVSAASAAEVAGEEQRRDELVREAANLDERHPRVVLATIADDADATTRLAALDGLTGRTREDRMLLAAQRTLAHLLEPDVAAARTALRELQAEDADGLLARGLTVSIVVQEGRLGVRAHRALDVAALRTALGEARALRDRLRAEKRWSESTRMVMLEADVHALLGDRGRASQTLVEALDEERRSQEQKEVLGMIAATRALDYPLTLELLAGADETPMVRRLRLEAFEASGSPAERDTALAGMDAIVLEGGEGALEMAFARLAATIGPRPTPWSAEAETYLNQHGHEREAVTTKTFHLLKTQGFAAAERELRPHGNTQWAITTRLRLSLSPRAPRDEARKSAERLLAFGPPPALRIEAAQGLARGGEHSRAREVLVAVARDPGVPDVVRADAYTLLMHVVGNDQGDWSFTAELHREWTTLAPTDTRLPAWAPRIANRLRN